MSRRPRVVWLVDDRSPTGALVMTLRRAAVLAGRAQQTVLALRPGPRPPVGTPAARIGRATGAAGELALAGADVVVTTSERTLASAAARRTGRGRLVHVVHEPALVTLGRARVARALPLVDWLLVPEGTDVARVAALGPVPAERIVAAADFVLPGDSLLSSARAHTVLAAGRLGTDDAVLELVDGFALADLPGWRLRVAGDGPGLPALHDHIAARGLGDRVRALGPRFDLAEQYLNAGIVARIAGPEAAGLSVLEAVAAGVPVLASPAAPAAVRHVRDGVNGVLLDRVDPVAVADALVALADDDRRLAYAASLRDAPVGLLDGAGRQRIETRFALVVDTPPGTSLHEVPA